jgi:hypothetical protein
MVPIFTYEMLEAVQIVTKKEGGREGHSNSGSVWHCGDLGLF